MEHHKISIFYTRNNIMISGLGQIDVEEFKSGISKNRNVKFVKSSTTQFYNLHVFYRITKLFFFAKIIENRP